MGKSRKARGEGGGSESPGSSGWETARLFFLLMLAFLLGALVVIVWVEIRSQNGETQKRRMRDLAATVTRTSKKISRRIGGTDAPKSSGEPPGPPRSSGSGSPDDKDDHFYTAPSSTVAAASSKSKKPSQPIVPPSPPGRSTMKKQQFWPSPCENDDGTVDPPPPCLLKGNLRGTVLDANMPEHNMSIRLLWRMLPKGKNAEADDTAALEEAKRQQDAARAEDAIASYTQLDLFDPEKVDGFTVLSRFRFFDLMRLYRNASTRHILDTDASPVQCVLALLHTENCDTKRESLVGCVAQRMGGPDNAALIVPNLCTGGGWWRWFARRTRRWMKARGIPLPPRSREALIVDPAAAWHGLKRGVIPTSTVVSVLHERQEYVPPEKRTVTPFGKPIYCQRTGVVVYPISYGLARNTIVDKVPRDKVFDWHPSKMRRWGQGGGYVYDLVTEMNFRESRTRSWFSTCQYRAGWESLRQYEILASGCVPWFADIARAPQGALSHLPRQLLQDIFTLPGVDHIPSAGVHSDRFDARQREYYEPAGGIFHVRKRPKIRTARFNQTRYFEIADYLLDWTKKYLTCGAIVASMLKRMGKENATRVLISTDTIDSYALFQPLSDSYQVSTVLQGFNELGFNVTLIAPRGVDSLKWRYRHDGFSPFRPKGPRTANDSGLLRDMPESDRGETVRSMYFQNLYGHAMGYKGRAPNGEYDQLLTKKDFNEIARMIRTREFDLVVFAFVDTNMRMHAPFIQLAAEHYSRDEIAVVDHLDHHVVAFAEYYWLCDVATIFVRESDETLVCNVDPHRPPPQKRICPPMRGNASDYIVWDRAY